MQTLKVDGKISVIIPCYNQAAFLRDAIDSVLAQTYTNWECIIINDGSTDDSETVALGLVEGDDRFIYKAQANKGLPGARNAALDLCSGEYIQLLDADDALHPQKLEQHIALINQSGLQKDALIVSYSEYCYGEHNDIYINHPATVNCRLPKGEPLQYLVESWENKLSITPNSFLFSANLFFLKGIRFDEAITTCEDIDCWIRILLLKPYILFLAEVLAYYRNTPGSLSKNLEKVWKGHVQVMEKHMALAGAGTPLYKWTRYKKNEVLVRYRQFGKMDWDYKLYFGKNILTYYLKRIFTN